MFSVKIFNKKSDRTESFDKTIGNIISHIYNKLSGKVKVASDSECIEIISGNTNISTSSDQIVAELLIKQTIVINKSDLKNRQELDKFITQIKNFCEKAHSVENSDYMPFLLRKKE